MDRWAHEVLFDADPDVAKQVFDELDSVVGPFVKSLKDQGRGARFQMNRWMKTGSASRSYMYEVTFEDDDPAEAAEIGADLGRPLLAPIASKIAECERRFGLRNINRVTWDDPC